MCAFVALTINDNKKRPTQTVEEADATQKCKGKGLARQELTNEDIFRMRLQGTSKRSIIIERDISFDELGHTLIFEEIR